MATAKELEDIMECPICTEVYTYPRVLPCGHTYCLKCIEAWRKDKQPGDKLACPECTKEFTLPSNGVSDLPKNVIVEKFLKIKELSTVESKTSPCEACSGGEESGSEVQNVASVYCVECQMKLCHNCERAHKGVKITRSHKLVTIGEEISVETFYQSTPPTFCDKHQNKNLIIYCFDCKLTICVTCYLNYHNCHKCHYEKEFVNEFHAQMTKEVDSIAKGVEKCRDILESLEKEENDFQWQTAKAGIEIGDKAEQLKVMIDVHKDELMNTLSTKKEKRAKKIEKLRKKIKRRLSSIESYKKSVDEARHARTASDIARAAASGLHDGAGELLFDDIERQLAQLSHVDVTFKSSDFVIDDAKKALGTLRVKAVKPDVKSSAPTPEHIIPSQGKNRVNAVTSLENHIFAIRYDSKLIEVYDAETFTLQRQIAVRDIGPWTHSMVVCARNKCLYLSNSVNNRIHRVGLQLSGSSAANWSVAPRPRGLSLNIKHNVVVACDKENKLQEYKPDGSLVREICLQGVAMTPRHAIQLSTDDYVVSQCTKPGVVSVVGVGGQVVDSYGESQTSYDGQMKSAGCLAVTKKDHILIADKDSKIILSINRTTGCIKEMSLSVDGETGPLSPLGLCLDETRGRLNVSESGGQCRIFVYDCEAFYAK